MGEAFIVRRGGIGSFAVIAVTYPSGSTCTCTNGARTLRAKNNSGSYLFLIPESGTWTVSCTDGTHTASKAVTISTEYQAESVKLTYALYLFKENVGVAGGFQCLAKTHGTDNPGFSVTSQKITTLTDTTNGYCNVYFTPAVDLTDYSTLLVDVKCIEQYSSDYGLNIVVGSDEPEDGVHIGNVAAEHADHYNTSRTTVSLDVSALTGQLYVKFGSTGCYAELYNVWLE